MLKRPDVAETYTTIHESANSDSDWTPETIDGLGPENIAGASATILSA
jgi:hypothetical protein